MNDMLGTKFSLLGTNKEIKKQKELIRKSYSNEEKKRDKPSIITFSLRKEKEGVRRYFLHSHVPDTNASSIEMGWKGYCLGSLKEYLESK